MDYRALGLKVGLEIHQQLATHKLFCEDVSRLVEEPGRTRFRRRLRPTQSELGEVDAAAIEEARRRLTFVYEATDNTCLVEADEEPPHRPNDEALDIALEIALLLHASPVREIHFMRKIVIDGSNTSGFQRSALVALGGTIAVGGKDIGVPTILLEEDAARKVAEAEDEVVYRLDRLGIPLVEVATTPDIETPEEARDVALAIGSLLRATREVLRGIGTIREDLNVSVRGGARIEIKGVQELRLIATFVEKEAERQTMLLSVASELRRRGVASVPDGVRDVTAHMTSSESKVVKAALGKGGKVLAWPLPGFAGLLKGKLGPELAARAHIAGVGGIFHSDELPAYGISATEVEAVRTALGLGPKDAFVVVADDEVRARRAFEEMRPRAQAALDGVPPETREPRPDGTTVYARPLPGKARMYPETDVPPVRVDETRLRRIRERLPEPPEAAIPRLARDYGIHEQQARQLFEDGTFGAFELIAREFGEARTAATTLTYTASEIRREGADVDAIPEDRWRELFSLLKAGRFAKEAIPALVREMARRGVRASEALGALGVTGMGRPEVEAVVDGILEAAADLLASRGAAAEKTLMGRAMERLRGRADGKLVSDVLRARLRERLESGKEKKQKN
ncbi:MAG: Glu-tRNA(Gln) amidotransferase subunit GatE [Methanobacteriota archaeon]